MELSETNPKLQSELKLFDVTNLVVGAIIGADIYVAASFGAEYLGPISLLVWVIAGIMAIIIALCFAQCAALLPSVGGPYAYAKDAWGPFPGFMVGWSLWLAEWMSLAVFPIAFVRYLMFFYPDLGWEYQVLVKGLFIAFLTLTNIIGIKAAGRTNDILTLAKITPLIFFAAIGLIFIISHPTATSSNLSPFSPLGLSNFGIAFVLIFWAYAGFEISTIPADEIKDPGKTIPKAIILGISIVTIFYLITNFVLFGVRPWNKLASDTAPLAEATTDALSINPTWVVIGGLIVGIGALISVTGSDESGMIGTSRLGYALAADGLFPHAFAKVHPKYKTPYLAIIIQGVTALIAAIIGNLGTLIATSVFLLSIAYLATSASVFSLRKKYPEPKFQLKGGSLIPILGIIFSLFLISQCTITQITIGLALLFFGILIYARYSPKEEIPALKKVLLSRDSVLARAYKEEEKFLAYIIRRIKRFYRRITGKQQTWDKIV